MKMRNRFKKTVMTGAVLVLALSALLVLAGCGAGDGGDSNKDDSNAGAYDISYRCTVDPEDVTVLMNQLNKYRQEQGEEPLKWNSDPEDEMLNRAAELAISYSETRLDGEPGPELWRGCFDDPELWAKELLADESFCKALCDSEKTSLCIGVIRSWTGDSFGVLDLYPKAGESEKAITDEPAWKADDDKNFVLKATDEHLNCHAQLMDEEMEPVDAEDLYAGESYYYVIYNNDPNNKNYEEEINVGYSNSENPDIVTIDQYGFVTAKTTGTTTIEVRPAEQSGIHLQLEVKVK